MGIITGRIDKLPRWLQWLIWLATAVGSVYYIAHYGIGRFLLRVIFSPEI